MPNEDGKVVFKTVVDPSGLEKGLDAAKATAQKKGDELEKSVSFGDKVKNKLSSTGTAIKENMGKAIGAVTGAMAIGVGKIAKHGLELASDLSEVQNVVDTTFGKNSGKIDVFAKSAGKSFGLSELSAKQYSSTLGAMTKSMGLSGDQVLTLSENLTGLSGDMASFYNLDPAEAFEKIRSGISGETEPLKQLGINMSEANLSAFALSKGIKKPYNEMSQGEQTMLRYNYLMTATKDAQGDFAKTSDSYANQQRLLQMQYDDTAATLGQTLLPIMVKLMNFINGLVTDISGFVKEHPQLAAAIGGIIVLLGLVFGGLSLLSTIMPIVTALTAASGVAAGGAAVGFGAMLLPIIIVIAAIAALIAITVLIVKNWEPIKGFFISLWNSIVAAFQAAINWIKSAWGSVTQFFASVWRGIQSVFSSVGSWFSSIFWGAVNAVKSAFNSVTGFFQWIWDYIKWVFGSVGNWFSSIFWNAVNAIYHAWNSVPDFFNQIWKWIKSIFDPDALWNIGQNLIYGLWNGIKSVKDWILGKISGFADYIVGGIKGFFGIHSPSRRMADEVGKFIPPGITKGAEKAMPEATQDMQGSLDSAMEKWSRGIRGDEDLVVNATRRVTGNVANQIYPTGAGAVNSITAAVSQNVSPAPAAPIMVSSPVYLDGKLISDNTTKHQQISAAVRGLTKQ